MTTLGDMLIDARKKAGLSAHDLAQRTRIMQAAIHNLEDDKLDALPAAGYVRGYILSYCKLCDVDPKPFLEQFERQSGSSRRDAIGDDPYRRSGQRGGGRQAGGEINWKVVIAVVIIIVLVAGVLFFANQGGNGDASRALPAEAAATTDVSPHDSEEGYTVQQESALAPYRIPFSFEVQARPGSASDIAIIVDGNLAFEGALTAGNAQSFTGVLEAQIEVAVPENVIIAQDDTEVPVPRNGALTLTAFE